MAAGASARAEHQRRAARDRAHVRANLRLTVPLVAATPLLVYLACRVGAALVDRLARPPAGRAIGHTAGAPGATVAAVTSKALLSAGQLDTITVVLAVAATLTVARAAWGRRPTTEAWRVGAEGERRLARRLSGLERDGFVVLHDRQLAGSRANVDHLVIGPTGLFVVDTKNYRGALRLASGTLWHGRYPVRIQSTRWEAQRVGELLGAALGAVRVRPLICVLGSDVPAGAGHLDGVRVVAGARRLGAELRRGRCVLGPADVERLAGLARAALPAYPPRRAPAAGSAR